MSDLKHLQTKNTALAVQILIGICIFMVQLFLLTISLRAFMGGNANILWPAAVCSLVLMLPLLLLSFVQRK